MVDGCSETSWTLSTANQGGCRMPFREVSRMDARLEFVMLASVEGANIRQLCPPLRHQPDDWLQVVGALADGRDDGAFGAVASAAQFAGAQRCSHGASSAFGTWRTSSLGWPQDRQAAEGSRAGRSSGALDGDGDPEAEWGRTGRAWWRPACLRPLRADAAERVVADGLQGPCGAAHRPASSADCARRSLALLGGTCGLRQRADRDGPAAAHHRLPPVRSAPEHDHRQWFALGRWTGQPVHTAR